MAGHLLAAETGQLTRDAPFDPLARRPAAEQRPLHPRREEVATFRVQVDLTGGAEPPIWRRLDLSSDLALDVFHQVLQAAVAWTDSHLHRFATGGAPFDPAARAFASDLDLDLDPARPGPARPGWSIDAGAPIRGNDLRWVAPPTLDALQHLGALVNQRRADRFGREVVGGPTARCSRGWRCSQPADAARLMPT